jgi:glucuronosyltransferase
MPPATYTTPYLGIPSTPSLRPLTFSSTCFKTKMSYMERVWSFLDYANFYVTQQSKYFKLLEAGYKAYFPDSPSIPEFLSNVSLILSNTHVSIDHSLAQSDLIEVGGMHCRPPKILPKVWFIIVQASTMSNSIFDGFFPQDIQQFLDGAGKDGFIFFSLGSALQGSQMPASFRKSILSTFSKLKQRVLWKFETEAMEDLPPNVKLTKWAPQQDVLGHKNIRLFITHSGLLSIQEAVYHGVPIIGIPILGDQFVNIQQAVDRGFGLELDFTTITEKSLTEAINIILSDSRY